MFDVGNRDLETLIRSAEADIQEWLEGARPLPLLRAADAARMPHYGRRVFFRGLIEFTNHCARNCLYCGLRAANGGVHRYRMTPDEILDCVRKGHAMGFRSFVLQGGEDPVYHGGPMLDVVARIKSEYPDSALTLSIGELSPSLYRSLKAAGADRYLLRHETANDRHYRQLHPLGMSLEARKACLWTLKDLGYAVGAGFMVGSPGQTWATLADDLAFLRELQPDMVGIGPFLPQSDTPFADERRGSLALTLAMVALVRLLLPKATLPATTALGALVPGGRELALQCGANVVMPNLTPIRYREDYALYDGKSGVDSDLQKMVDSITKAGFQPDFGRGDPASAGALSTCDTHG